MNILIIPHIYIENVKLRSFELAKILSEDEKLKIFFLRWHTVEDDRKLGIHNLNYSANNKESESVLFNKFKKIKFYFKNLFISVPVQKRGKVYLINCPVLLIPKRIALHINLFFLKQIIKKFKINSIINAAPYYFPISKIKNNRLTYIYDLVDDHTSNCLESNKKKYKDFIFGEMKNSDKNIVVSRTLEEIIEKKYNIKSIPVFNGADVKIIRSSTGIKNKNILEKYNLANFKIIGYTGNFGSWSGLDFLIESFCIYKKKYHLPAKLLIVGPVADKTDFVSDIDTDIIFTGKVLPETIPDYLSVFDIAVLPFRKIPFTDNAFPIKIIEYGAARIPVISTSLEELKLHELKYVKFSDDKEEWSELFYNTDKRDWKSEWDNIVDRYDWRNLVKPIKDFLLFN